MSHQTEIVRVKPIVGNVAAFGLKSILTCAIMYEVHLTRDEVYELVADLMVQLQHHDESYKSRSEFVDLKITAEGIQKHTASPHLPSASEDVTS